MKTSSKWAKRKKVIAIIAVIMLFTSTPAFAYLFTQMHDANEAFDTFGGALVSKDYASAYSLTTVEFQAVMDKSAFVDQQAALSSNLGALKKVTRGWSSETEGNEDGWSSTINARFEFEQANRQFVFRMKKQGDEWRVFGYKEQ
jgi:hypothetical protein